jgi:putative SOS response-associated peptidase YedK
MCSNYRPVTRADRMLAFFGVERGRDEPSADVFPSGLAPMIRLAHDDGSVPVGRLALADAIFRFVPDFIAKVEWARRTYNARSETVATKSTYKDAWAKRQRCIIPTESFYEPNYESGKAARWNIQQPGEVPMGIAGIYRMWQTPDGRDVFSMSMLTVNADDHPLIKRFHRPGEEKRMVVILDPADYSRWLSCAVEEAAAYFKQWQGPLDASAAPLPPRASPSVTQAPHKPRALE